MAGYITPIQKPSVLRAPSAGAGGTLSPAHRSGTHAPERIGAASETDVYLQRSYALVQHLRQILAQRRSVID